MRRSCRGEVVWRVDVEGEAGAQDDSGVGQPGQMAMKAADTEVESKLTIGSDRRCPAVGRRCDGPVPPHHQVVNHSHIRR